MKRIGMVVPTSGYDADEIERRRTICNRILPVGYEVTFLVPPESPEFLDEAHHFGTAIGAVGGLLSGLDPSEVQAVIFAGAIDPGLAAARSVSPVPVVGTGEAAMYLASIEGRPLSVVTVDEHAVARTAEFLDAVPAKPPIASVRSLDLPVRQIMQDFDVARDRIRSRARAAVEEDGAEAVYLGAWVLGTLGIDAELRTELGVSIYNPAEISLRAAMQVIRARHG